MILLAYVLMIGYCRYSQYAFNLISKTFSDKENWNFLIQNIFLVQEAYLLTKSIMRWKISLEEVLVFNHCIHDWVLFLLWLFLSIKKDYCTFVTNLHHYWNMCYMEPFVFLIITKLMRLQCIPISKFLYNLTRQQTLSPSYALTTSKLELWK